MNYRKNFYEWTCFICKKKTGQQWWRAYNQCYHNSFNTHNKWEHKFCMQYTWVCYVEEVICNRIFLHDTFVTQILYGVLILYSTVLFH